MIDEPLSERLQPSLLDRLTDPAPDRLNEDRKSRVIDVRRLREIVQRDLTWLLNTQNLDSEIDAEIYPNIATSVLNFGIREFAGEMSTRERALMIRKVIHDVILRYEPRIRPSSLKVDFEGNSDARSTVISFNIRAEMWAKPLPLELYLRSHVNVTTGELALESRH